jgi:hypothetical protein
MRAMRGVMILLVMPAALIADIGRVFSEPGLKTGPTYQAPLAGLFNEQQGPVVNYRGYAYADCAASAPAVRVVALQGVVPEGIPRTPPRPSIEIQINAPLDKAVGQQFTVDPKAGAGGAVVSSCPVVGDCSPAGNGTVAVTSKADDGTIVGEFRAKWAIGAPRAGRFTVAWRQSENKCG